VLNGPNEFWGDDEWEKWEDRQPVRTVGADHDVIDIAVLLDLPRNRTGVIGSGNRGCAAEDDNCEHNETTHGLFLFR
jgi:hypothetical protein